MLLSPPAFTCTSAWVFSPKVPLAPGMDTSAVLSGTFFRVVWNVAIPEGMFTETLRAFVEGSSDVSSTVSRLSGRMWTTVPSKNVISAAAPGLVRTRSRLRRTVLLSALIQSVVPNGRTWTFPSRDVKWAVVSVTGGGGAAAGGGGFQM